MTTLAAIILFSLRMIIIGAAVGALYLKFNLFCKMKPGHTILIGFASAPFFASLADYLLGFIFIGWNSIFYYIVPLIFALFYLLWKRNYKTVVLSISDILERGKDVAHSAGKWIYFDLALAVAVTLAYVFFFNAGASLNNIISSLLNSDTTVKKIFIIILVSLIIFFIALIVRKIYLCGKLKTNFYAFLTFLLIGYTIAFGALFNGVPNINSDRAHYMINARYFVEDKNSFELDNYSDQKYGSTQRDDHGPLWTMYLADADINTDMFGFKSLSRLQNFASFWILCCFFIFLFLSAFFVSKRYAAGIISIYILLLYKYFLSLMTFNGSRDAFRCAGLLLLLLFVLNFIPEIIKNKQGRRTVMYGQYVFMFIFCYFCINGHQGNVYIMTCMFLIALIILVFNKTNIKSILLCVLTASAGTLLGALKTFAIYSETGRISSSTIVPFHDTPVVEQVTEVNANRGDLRKIIASYSFEQIFLICLGAIALLVIIVYAIKKKDKNLLIAGMIILGMLLPLTGIMNWTGYNFPLWFFEQLRYRIYFLTLFALTGAWLITRLWRHKYINVAFNVLIGVVFVMSLFVQIERYENLRVPQGCGKYYLDYLSSKIDNYKSLAAKTSALTEANVFTHNEVLAYYIQENPKLLYHIYTEELIQAKTEAEIEKAMEKLNVGAILLPSTGKDYIDYSLLPFWKYINENENFIKIPDEKSGYVIFYRNNV